MKILAKPITVWVTACDHNRNVILNYTRDTNCVAATRMFAEMEIAAEYHSNIVITDLNNNPVAE